MANDKNTIRAFIEERLRAFNPDIDTSTGSQAYAAIIQPTVDRFGDDDLMVDSEKFIKARLLQEFPSVSSSELDAVYDLLVKPHIAFLDPFRREVRTIQLAQAPVKNFASLAVEEVDAAMDNWFTARRRGNSSVGAARIYYRTPQRDTYNLGDSFYDKNGAVYHPVTATIIRVEDLMTQREDGQYFWDLMLRSETSGDDKNIDKDMLVRVDNHPGVVKVINRAKFRYGKTEETAEEFLSWAKDGLTERTLTTAKGIVTRIYDTMPDVRKVEIVGYGDPEMQRDIIRGSDNGLTISAGMVFVLGQTAFFVSAWEDRDIPSEGYVPRAGDVLELFYGVPLYVGIADNQRVDRIDIDSYLGTTHDILPDFPTMSLLHLARLPEMAHMSVTPFFPRMLMATAIIKRKGALRLTDIPGGILNPNTEDGSLLITPEELHIGGHYDVFVRPSAAVDASVSYQNVRGNEVIASGASLSSYGLTSSPNKVSDNNPNVLFDQRGVKRGDHLVIESGVDASTYRILSVWHHDLFLDRDLTQNADNIRYAIYRGVRLDLSEGKNVLFPLSESDAGFRLSGIIGVSDYRTTVDLRGGYGAETGDTLEILDGVSKGTYTIIGWSKTLGGKAPTLDRASSHTFGGATFRVYRPLQTAQLPLLRVKTVDLLDSNQKASGVKLPYALPVDARSVHVAGSEQKCEDAYGFVLPDLQAFLLEDNPCTPVNWPTNWEWPPAQNSWTDNEPPIWRVGTAEFVLSAEAWAAQVTYGGDAWDPAIPTDERPPDAHWPPPYTPDGRVLVDVHRKQRSADDLPSYFTDPVNPADWGLTGLLPEDIFLWNPDWDIQYTGVDRGPFAYSGGFLRDDGTIWCLEFDDGRAYEVLIPASVTDGRNNAFLAFPKIPWAEMAVWYYNSFLNPMLLYSTAGAQYDPPPAGAEAEGYWTGDYSEAYGYGYYYYYLNEPWYKPDQPQPAYDLPPIPVPCLGNASPGDVLTLQAGPNAGAYRIKKLSVLPINFGYFVNAYPTEKPVDSLYDRLSAQISPPANAPADWFIHPGGVWDPAINYSENAPWPGGYPPKSVWERQVIIPIVIAEIETEFPYNGFIGEFGEWLSTSDFQSAFNGLLSAFTSSGLSDIDPNTPIGGAVTYISQLINSLSANWMVGSGKLVVTGRTVDLDLPAGYYCTIGVTDLTDVEPDPVEESDEVVFTIGSSAGKMLAPHRFDASPDSARFDYDSVMDGSLVANLGTASSYLLAYCGQRWNAHTSQFEFDIGFARSVGTSTSSFNRVSGVSVGGTSAANGGFSGVCGLTFPFDDGSDWVKEDWELIGASNPKLYREGDGVYLFFLAHWQHKTDPTMPVLRLLARAYSSDEDNKVWQSVQYAITFSGSSYWPSWTPDFNTNAFAWAPITITGYDIWPSGPEERPILFISSEGYPELNTNPNKTSAIPVTRQGLIEAYTFGEESFSTPVVYSDRRNWWYSEDPLRLGCVYLADISETETPSWRVGALVHMDHNTENDDSFYGFVAADSVCREYIFALDGVTLLDNAYHHDAMNDSSYQWAGWGDQARWASDIVETAPIAGLLELGTLPSTKTLSFWLLAFFFENLLMNEGLDIPDLGISMPTREFLDLLHFYFLTPYSVGKPSEGTARLYFQEPTSITCYGGGVLDDAGDPVQPTQLIGADENGEAISFLVDSHVPPFPVIPASSLEAPTPVSYPRDLSVVDKYAGVVQLTDRTRMSPIELEIDPQQDVVEIYPEIYMNYYYGPWNQANGPVPVNQGICGVKCVRGSSTLELPQNSGPKFLPSIEGGYIFIEEGANAGGYRVTRWLNSKQVEVDAPMAESTLPEDSGKSNNVVLADMDTDAETFISSQWTPRGDDWKAGIMPTLVPYGSSLMLASDGSDVGKYLTLYGTRFPASWDGTYKIVAYNTTVGADQFGYIVIERAPFLSSRPALELTSSGHEPYSMIDGSEGVDSDMTIEVDYGSSGTESETIVFSGSSAVLHGTQQFLDENPVYPDIFAMHIAADKYAFDFYVTTNPAVRTAAAIVDQLNHLLALNAVQQRAVIFVENTDRISLQSRTLGSSSSVQVSDVEGQRSLADLLGMTKDEEAVGTGTVPDLTSIYVSDIKALVEAAGIPNLLIDSVYHGADVSFAIRVSGAIALRVSNAHPAPLDAATKLGIESAASNAFTEELGMCVVHAAPSVAPTLRSEGGTNLVGVAPFRAYEGTPRRYTIDYVDPTLDPFTSYMILSSYGSRGQSRYIPGGYMMPYRVVRPYIQRISSTQMSRNRQDGLYYFDVRVVSGGAGDRFNLPVDTKLEPVFGTYDADGYYYEVEDTNFTFSAHERVQLRFSNRFLPVGSEDSAENYLPTVGKSWKVNYEYSPTVAYIQNMLSSRAERAPGANPLARHFLPSYVYTSLACSGGSAGSIIAKEINELIAAKGGDVGITVDDLEKIMRKNGTDYIRHPITIVALTHDLDRRIVGNRAQNVLGGTDPYFFAGSNRISYFTPGAAYGDVQDVDIPDGERTVCRKVTRGS